MVTLFKQRVKVIIRKFLKHTFQHPHQHVDLCLADVVLVLYDLREATQNKNERAGEVFFPSPFGK